MELTQLELLLGSLTLFRLPISTLIFRTRDDYRATTRRGAEGAFGRGC
jgi:hypothetical protein